MATCDCFTGTPTDADYTPLGTFNTIQGLPTYTSSPKAGQDAHDKVLFLPDGFGLAKHNLVLADLYAKNGCETTIVDYFQGDALPELFMSYTPGTDINTYSNFTPEQKDIIRKIDMPTWLSRHDPPQVMRLLDAFFPEYLGTGGEHGRHGQDVDASPRAKLHVIGHCFGGKYALRFAKLSDVESAIAFHPSFLEPSDTSDLQKPVFVGCAETDIFTPSLISVMLSRLPESGARWWKFLVYGGTKHGFASRVDHKDEKARQMYWQAFDDSVRWMWTQSQERSTG